MGVEIRGIEQTELEELVTSIFWAFGKQPTAEELEDECTVAEVDRMIGAVADDRFVGTAGAFTFDLTVPGGGQLPVAGVTMVGVLPTHRRQGILASMMAYQLDDVAARGEPIAVLTASEAGIYGRFGYGVGTRVAKVSVDTSRGLPLAVEPAAGGSLQLVDPADHSTVSAPIYDTVRRSRVGEVSRSDTWWALLQRDRELWRDDASARFCVVHRADDGSHDGYCRYRVKRIGGPDGTHHGEVRVLDLAATSPEVEAALLAYLADIDLTRSITTWIRPVDDSWPYRLADRRRYKVDLLHDHLYVRLLDVPAALSARSYEAPGTLVITVDDPFRPNAGGTFRLAVADDGTAACEPAPAAIPDLQLGAAALGSLYLGDVAPSVLAAAGRLAARSTEALAAADRVFPTARHPFCTSEF